MKKEINSNNGNVKESIPSTNINNQLIKQRKQEMAEPFDSPIKNSNVSLATRKIPCFEWKTDTTKGTKTAEFYLNIYYHKKKNGVSAMNNEKNKKRLDSNNSLREDDEEIDIEDLPFNYKEYSLTQIEEEKIVKILKNQIVFQGVSPEILSVISHDMIMLSIPEGKIIYDINDDGNFFYIIGKGSVVVNIQDNDSNTKFIYREKKRRNNYK